MTAHVHDGFEQFLRLALIAGTTSPPREPACLPFDTLAALAAGTAGARHVKASVSHLASCVSCRRAVASTARALGARDVARAVRAADQSRGRALRIGALALPVAAALLLLSRDTTLRSRIAPPHRAPTITATDRPHGLVPSGPGVRPSQLGWSAVAGADAYRVTVFSATGSTIYEARVTDTFATLPDSIALTAGANYLWQVEARTSPDRWTPSELVVFSVTRAR